MRLSRPGEEGVGIAASSSPPTVTLVVVALAAVATTWGTSLVLDRGAVFDGDGFGVGGGGNAPSAVHTRPLSPSVT